MAYAKSEEESVAYDLTRKGRGRRGTRSQSQMNRDSGVCDATCSAVGGREDKG